MGEFVLDFADARDSDDPADTVHQFLQQTYSAAPDLAKWDRATRGRTDDVAAAMRLKRGQATQKPPR
jgi:hypothetical protein